MLQAPLDSPWRADACGIKPRSILSSSRLPTTKSRAENLQMPLSLHTHLHSRCSKCHWTALDPLMRVAPNRARFCFVPAYLSLKVVLKIFKCHYLCTHTSIFDAPSAIRQPLTSWCVWHQTALDSVMFPLTYHKNSSWKSSNAIIFAHTRPFSMLQVPLDSPWPADACGTKPRSIPLSSCLPITKSRAENLQMPLSLHTHVHYWCSKRH